MSKVIAFLAVLLFSGAAIGAEPFVLVQYAGADQPGAISINWASLFQDPMVMTALVIGGLLFASKVLKLDLTKFFPVVMSLLNSLLKPPGPATPALPVAPATPVAPNLDFLQILLKLLDQSRHSGDVELEAAIKTVLFRANK
jgi:hypothetical protein